MTHLMEVFQFGGYWRDVCTLYGYYQTNPCEIPRWEK